MDSQSLLVIASGSAALTSLTHYIKELRIEVDREITVLLTASAERFVRPEVVGWFADQVLTSDTPGLQPVQLAKTARALVVLPATANTLSAAALGLAATPAQTALLAAPSPSLYFPSMNPSMWAKPAIKRHVQSLRDQGDTVVDPEEAEVFELWRRERHMGLLMPGPDEAAAIVKAWLLDGAAAVPAAAAACATCGR
jgi:phosphopantothenoylcysteine synthetase/decarboxylase